MQQREQALQKELEKSEEQLKGIMEDCQRVKNYDKLSSNEQLTLGLNKDLKEIKDFMKRTLEDGLNGPYSE